MAGDPMPYSYANDNLVTSLLILGFILIAFAFSRMSNFIVGQAKNFIHPSQNSLSLSETSGEIYMQIVLTGLTCIVYALLCHRISGHNLCNIVRICVIGHLLRSICRLLSTTLRTLFDGE